MKSFAEIIAAVVNLEATADTIGHADLDAADHELGLGDRGDKALREHLDDRVARLRSRVLARTPVRHKLVTPAGESTAGSPRELAARYLAAPDADAAAARRAGMTVEEYRAAIEKYEAAHRGQRG